MKYKDYYEILGISRDAELPAIKKAYRKLAKKYHPDVSKEKNAETHFKEVGEAYEVLKDSEKRQAYDQFGSNWQSGQDFTPPQGYQTRQGHSAQGFSSNAGFSDFFESLFGQQGFEGQGFGGQSARQQTAFPGEDKHSVLNLNLEDVFKGGSRLLTINTTKIDASGHEVLSPSKIRVTIPAGITEGKRIRIKGYGSPGQGGAPAGDLFLEVKIRPHPQFKVDGSNIYSSLILMPWEAALGTKKRISTLHGKLELKIPPASKTDQKLRIKGKGLGQKNHGDQIVELKIQTPKAVNDEQKKLYQQMAELFKTKG